MRLLNLTLSILLSEDNKNTVSLHFSKHTQNTLKYVENASNHFSLCVDSI